MKRKIQFMAMLLIGILLSVNQSFSADVLTINSSTTNFPSSYAAAKDYTLGGVSFNITQAYVTGGKLQWRAAGNKNGTGTMYNKTALSNIQSIVLVYDGTDTGKNFTVTVGSSSNPTSGTSITPTANQAGDTYTYDCSSGSYSYFVLTNGSGAGYLTSITINYGSSGSTYTVVFLTQAETFPLLALRYTLV